MLACHLYIFRGEVCVQIFGCSLDRVVRFPIKFWELFMYFGYKSFIRYGTCKYFLAVRALCFHSLNSAFQRAEVLHFDDVQLINFYLWWSMFLMPSLRNLWPNPRSQKIFLLCFFFPLEFYSFWFYISGLWSIWRSMINSHPWREVWIKVSLFVHRYYNYSPSFIE